VDSSAQSIAFLPEIKPQVYPLPGWSCDCRGKNLFNKPMCSINQWTKKHHPLGKAIV
jgi:hypothetical protein